MLTFQKKKTKDTQPRPEASLMLTLLPFNRQILLHINFSIIFHLFLSTNENPDMFREYT